MYKRNCQGDTQYALVVLGDKCTLKKERKKYLLLSALSIMLSL